MHWLTGLQRIWTQGRGTTSRPVARMSVFLTLLIALIVSGTVPQGFMRDSRAGGMALVLCTPEGPTEVWLTAEGEIEEVAPTDHSSKDAPACLAVTLSMVLVQAQLDTLGQTAEFAPYRTTFIDRRSALVTTHTPLQPRAPPAFT